MNKTVEIVDWIHPGFRKMVQAIVVDGSVFVWGLSPESLEKARDIWRNDSSMKVPICQDIHQHFIKSFSKFVGREVTLHEVIEAIEQGYIEV